MADLNQLKAEILADGRIDDAEVARLRTELYADGVIDRDEVEFLIALREEAKEVSPAFEKLYFQALKENVLQDGVIDAAEAAWLRRMLFADGRIDENEKQFLRDLSGGATSVSPEFRQLYDECMKQ